MKSPLKDAQETLELAANNVSDTAQNINQSVDAFLTGAMMIVSVVGIFALTCFAIQIVKVFSQ